MAHCHRNKCCNTCCDSCCDGGCGSGSGCGGGGCGGAYGGGAYGGVGVGGLGAPAVMPGAGEQIKVLPKDSKDSKDSTTPGKKLPSGNGSVQSNGPGVTPTSSNALDTETKNPPF